MSDPPSANPPSPPSAEKVKATLFQQRFQFVGPLPPPGILEQYEKISPGAAARIMDAAHAESVHRQTLESTALNANIEAMRRQYAEARVGQAFALIIALAFVMVGGYVSTHGQPWSGTILGSIGLGGIVTAFIVGRGKNNPPAEPSTTNSSSS
jgi:uncharacterized membrane protein